MPCMDGLHFLAKLRELNPAVYFCFMTGESADYSRADLFATGADHVFQKPFPSLEDLAQEIHELATATRPRGVRT